MDKPCCLPGEHLSDHRNAHDTTQMLTRRRFNVLTSGARFRDGVPSLLSALWGQRPGGGAPLEARWAAAPPAAWREGAAAAEAAAAALRLGFAWQPVAPLLAAVGVQGKAHIGY